ncbi:unnamed protein product [Meloidogyne enterolobii]|uniref:Uncharacterized protein n=1 Tax=Meloidogyne enterolobii TaxID=390850 RepID=A0ACB0YAA6_MELEN
MNEAYDDLTKRAPRKLSPQKAIDLQLAIKDIENAKSPVEVFGFDPTKTIDINDLDELEKRCLDKEKAIKLLIGDNDVQTLKGLKERALDAIESIN